VLYAEDVIYTPNSNHKSKTSNRYAKNKKESKYILKKANKLCENREKEERNRELQKQPQKK